MVSADQIGLDFSPPNRSRLIDLGMKLILEANQQLTVRHPTRPEVNTVDICYEWARMRKHQNLADVGSFSECMRKIHIAAENEKPQGWIIGQGFNESDWPENRMPSELIWMWPPLIIRSLYGGVICIWRSPILMPLIRPR